MTTSRPLRIALFDRDEAWATKLAASLHACGLTVIVFHLTDELLTSTARTEVDAVVLSWPHVDDELALLVELLSRDCAVVALIADNDVPTMRLMFASGAAEVCHPLLPATRLSGTIEHAVASSRTRRFCTRIWQPTM